MQVSLAKAPAAPAFEIRLEDSAWAFMCETTMYPNFRIAHSVYSYVLLAQSSTSEHRFNTNGKYLYGDDITAIDLQLL